jgi:cation transport regulator ChaC
MKRYYFAYSSALDTKAFDEWKIQHGYHHFQLPPGQRARAKDVELNFDFPSRFWGGRVLGLRDKKGSSVEGVLFEIPAEEWLIVGHKEGLMTGAAVEKEVQVLRHDSSTPETPLEVPITATTFVTHPSRRSQEGDVSTRFVDVVKRAYEHWGLDPSAIDSLMP